MSGASEKAVSLSKSRGSVADVRARPSDPRVPRRYEIRSDSRGRIAWSRALFFNSEKRNEVDSPPWFLAARSLGREQLTNTTSTGRT